MIISKKNSPINNTLINNTLIKNKLTKNNLTKKTNLYLKKKHLLDIFILLSFTFLTSNKQLLKGFIVILYVSLLNSIMMSTYMMTTNVFNLSFLTFSVKGNTNNIFIIGNTLITNNNIYQLYK